jgi:hypothetical protein
MWFVLSRTPVFSPLTHPQISSRERRLVVIFHTLTMPPPRFHPAEGLVRLVLLRIGFRRLITAFHELRRVIQRGFEQP